MDGTHMSDHRYPIGEFTPPDNINEAQRHIWIEEVERLPGELRAAVAGLSDAQLDTPYRDGGWTVRQVVHHLPDSHMNCYTRFKLALTEEVPTIRPYDEKRWAELADSQAPIEISLGLFEAVHQRWVLVLRAMTEEDFARTFHHPDMEEPQVLAAALGSYAWHGRHHVAHITALRQRMGWT